MVTITRVLQRQTTEGNKFCVLELEGDIEIACSQSNGKPYATTKKCTIPCTFDEATAKRMIGLTLEGEIVRENCEPYTYINPRTNETIMLTHRYVFKAAEQFLHELSVV
jgi:hypothetical protein